MKLTKHVLVGLAASSLIILAACRETPTTDTSTTTGANARIDPNAPNPNVTHTADIPSATSPAAGVSPQDTAGATSLSDAQLIQVTHFANVGEIAQAKLAQDKTKNEEVKKFAAHMIKDHSEADAKGMDLSKKENFALADSYVSASLKDTADKLTADMSPKMGAEFDNAYVDAQVKEHQAVLDTLDNKLIPAARDADVKSYLLEVRVAVAKHLEHAKTVQASLIK